MLSPNKKVAIHLAAAGCMFLGAGSASAVVSFDQNVTNAVIFGTGNGNGGWTVDRNAAVGIELGLRAKVRYSIPGDSPQDVFNSNGAGDYNHAVGAPVSAPARGRWNFEFSINSNYNAAGTNLDQFNYLLQIDHNPSQAATFASFDPLNLPNPLFDDHSFGTNATTMSNGVEATDLATFNSLKANYNLVQNSKNMAFFPTLFAFNPNIDATYTFVLSAFRSTTLVASTTIDVIVGNGGTPVPVPSSLLLLVPGVLALWATSQRRRSLA